MTDETTHDSSRREFLGTVTLGGAGAALGISAYFTSPKRRANWPDLSELRKPENRVRMGFIGVGNRGGSLLGTAIEVPGAVPVAVADVQESKRNAAKRDTEKAMAEKLGDPGFRMETYADYRELLDNPDVEAVVIATPHYLHAPMAFDAIEAGKHVYCEKAMAFTIGENQDLYNKVRVAGAQAADGGDLVFQVGHQRHYSPLYRKVLELVEGDRIGDVAAARAQWHLNNKIRRPVADPELEKVINWRLYSELSGGLTTEYATHQIDVINWMLGTHPDSVCGFGGVDWFQDGRDTTDNIHLIFNYKVPIPERDAYGRKVRDASGKVVYERDASGQPKRRDVRFTYTCIMQNAHLGPSELLMGRYGTIGTSLGGGEFWKEEGARQDPNRIAEGTNPARAKQKDILASGPTVAQGYGEPEGEPIDDKIRKENGDIDRRHWTRFNQPLKKAYDRVETLLAVESYAECIRRSRAGQPFGHLLSADVEIGMWSAVPALMANIAMREERTVYWREFFPDGA